MSRHGLWAIALLSSAVLVAPAAAQNCGGDFGNWLDGVREEALAQGVSPAAVAVLDDVRFDQSIIDMDRRQGVFAQTFLEFSGRMVNSYRLKHGAARLSKYKKTFDALEEQYGVPPGPIASFWGLETDYGANLGKSSTLNSLASLAFDCRRPEKFRPELIAALRIIERGDLAPEEMRGAWAGEIGQAQFMAKDYFEKAVDYDGDGRRNLLKSVPDVLASSANYLSIAGWRRGEPWLEEVRVPPDLDWQQADLEIKHPRAQWAKWGVRTPSGKPIEADELQASLLLPMGRNGPAFLAYENFNAFLTWNQSLVYATTAAYFATRLQGAPAVGKGNGEVEPFGAKQVFELQELLTRHGYDIGKVDGKLGLATRGAVKEVQIKLGMPADSYPTSELLARLRDM